MVVAGINQLCFSNNHNKRNWAVGFSQIEAIAAYLIYVQACVFYLFQVV